MQSGLTLQIKEKMELQVLAQILTSTPVQNKIDNPFPPIRVEHSSAIQQVLSNTDCLIKCGNVGTQSENSGCAKSSKLLYQSLTGERNQNYVQRV